MEQNKLQIRINPWTPNSITKSEHGNLHKSCCNNKLGFVKIFFTTNAITIGIIINKKKTITKNLGYGYKHTIVYINRCSDSHRMEIQAKRTKCHLEFLRLFGMIGDQFSF